MRGCDAVRLDERAIVDPRVRAAVAVTPAGPPIELHVDGDPFPLPRGVDFSAYRIVQEGLTNALKHAHASTANMTVRYALDELQIEVSDNGVG